MGNCTKPSMKDKIKKVRSLKIRCTFFLFENVNSRINSATLILRVYFLELKNTCTISRSHEVP